MISDLGFMVQTLKKSEKIIQCHVTAKVIVGMDPSKSNVLGEGDVLARILKLFAYQLASEIL